MKVEASTFVIKHGDKFCRFGSYGQVAMVENPLAATLYQRRCDAKNRIQNLGEHYVGDLRIPNSEFRIAHLTGALAMWEVSR